MLLPTGVTSMLCGLERPRRLQMQCGRLHPKCSVQRSFLPKSSRILRVMHEVDDSLCFGLPASLTTLARDHVPGCCTYLFWFLAQSDSFGLGLPGPVHDCPGAITERWRKEFVKVVNVRARCHSKLRF